MHLIDFSDDGSSLTITFDEEFYLGQIIPVIRRLSFVSEAEARNGSRVIKVELQRRARKLRREIIEDAINRAIISASC